MYKQNLCLDALIFAYPQAILDKVFSEQWIVDPYGHRLRARLASVGMIPEEICQNP